MTSRRLFIIGIATASTFAIAGCTGESGTEDNSDDVAASGTGEGPEDVMRDAFDALEEGDVETLDEVVHPESPGYPVDQNSIPDDYPSVDEINTISESEVAEIRDSTEENIRENRDELMDEPGIDDVAFVRVTYEDGPAIGVGTAVEDDGEWYYLNIQ